MNRQSGQSRRTLLEFYSESEAEGEYLEIFTKLGSAMVVLINAIDQRIKYKIWGLTSMYQLILLCEDDWQSPWKIRISPNDSPVYRIEYLLSPEANPWPDSRAVCYADSVDEAIDRILAAIEHSGIYEKILE